MLQKDNISYYGNDWYLIHCQPRKERYASHNLESQLGLSIFLPEYEIRTRGEMRKTPFFPGYIFVQVNLQQTPLSCINATPGVKRLVAFGNEPSSIPFEVIKMIHERLMQCERIYAQPFQAGDIVRVKKEGPLQDLEMVFVGPSTPSRRVTVLLNLLGRFKEVYLDIDILEKVAGSSSHQSESYARDKERSIVRSA